MKLLRWTFLTSLMLWIGAVVAIPQGLLEVEQTLSQTTMAVRSCQGDSEQTTVTLTLRSNETVSPVDVVLVLDGSSSEDVERVQAAALRFLDHLNGDSDDRVAVVSFADTARLALALDGDAAAARAAIAALPAGRLTALGDALHLALEELDAQRREGAVPGIVVFSDGGATTGLDPLAQADRAGALGLPVYFMGISPNVNRAALSGLAERAGGAFFASPSQQGVLGLLKRFERELVAEFITIDQTLPDALRFAGAPEGSTAPETAFNERSGTTRLSWALDALVAGQTWQTQYSVIATQVGTFALQRESQLGYLNDQGARVQESLPNPELTVSGTPPPVAGFELSPALPKAGQVVAFSDRSTAEGSTINQWAWNFGDGATSNEQHPTHIYEDLGRYTVRLSVTDDRACTAVSERGFRISEFEPSPEVNVRFEPVEGRPGQSIDFSVAPGELATACRWDFGDGAASDQCAASHSYAKAGNYRVLVEVTLADGRVLTLSRLFTVLPEGGGLPEVVDPTLPAVTIEVVGTPKSGQDTSFDIATTGEATGCAWTFGDGGTGAGCAATHAYVQAGTYTVTVEVTFAGGTQRASTQVVVLRENQPPVAGFTFAPPVQRVARPVGFDSSPSADPDGSIAAWSWEFGDGSSAVQANPIHEFRRPGTYTVTLTVTDDEGKASAPVSQQVFVGLGRGAFGGLSPASQGPVVPEWMAFYIDGGVVTDEELEDAARRFANGSFVQSTQYRLTEGDLRAITDLHELRLLTTALRTPAEAEAAGYVKVGDYQPGRGADYVNEDILNADHPPQFDEVPLLVYAPDGEGNLRLAGVRYVAFSAAEAELFGLSEWQSLRPPRPPGAPAPPPDAPQGIPETIYVLTVWIWWENPEGMFVPLNPALK